MAKMMVVDDNFDDLSEIRNVLVGAGHDVQIATNGAQAMDLDVDGSFELILIDIRMPTLSGYDLLNLLKDRLNGHTKVIFISIVPKKDVDTHEVDGFVQKPFSKESLLIEVDRVLGV